MLTILINSQDSFLSVFSPSLIKLEKGLFIGEGARARGQNQYGNQVIEPHIELEISEKPEITTIIKFSEETQIS